MELQSLFNSKYLTKIYTLGTFSIHSENGELGISQGKMQKKPLELIKILIAMGGKDVSGEIVTDSLWPDLEGDYAYKTLLTNIRRARKILGHPNSIIFHGGLISINREIVWVDCFAFKQELDKVQALCNGKNRETTITHCWERLDLYKGHFLANDQYPWAISLREQLKTYFYLSGEHIGTCYEKQDQHWEDIIRYYNAMLEIDDSIELFYQKLMALYTKLNRIDDAIRTYKRCETVLRANFFIKPSHSTTHFYENIMQQNL